MASTFRIANERSSEIPSVAISTVICVWTAGLFIALSHDCLHWFIIPATACGIVIGIDAVDWFRGRLEILDPAGLLGFYGVFFFFLAPLSHVGGDFYADDWLLHLNTPPEDWRPWIGAMAALNFAGLMIYRPVRRFFSRPRAVPEMRSTWRIVPNRFVVVLGLMLLVSAGLQYWVYLKVGGVANYIAAYEEKGSDAFFGFGRIFAISESFPILFIIGVAVLGRNSALARNRAFIAALIVLFVLLALPFGGLRGNRGSMVWNLFCAVGVTHFLLRPISKKMILAGLVPLVAFMYAYGFYKWGGKDAVTGILDSKERAAFIEESEKSLARAVLFDLGRCDNQAYLLYRLTHFRDFDYALGRTYLGALSLYIPASVWPNRPPTKRKEGTEAVFGRGSYVPDEVVWKWVYGLAGETMLNFTWVAVPFAFAPLGAFVGWVRRFRSSLPEGDGRIILLPFLVSVCFILLVWDSNVIVTHFVRFGFVPMILLILTTRRVRVRIGEWPARRSIANPETAPPPSDCAVA